MPDESSTSGTYNTVLPDEKELVAEIRRTQALLQDRKGLHSLCLRGFEWRKAIK